MVLLLAEGPFFVVNKRENLPALWKNRTEGFYNEAI